eukprot:TRINITY_DN3039_c0_g1_i2.p1 TRINITY_DN3039_c0_g1~~TRINITY_DN3039_c0_g1_i2.p1  ORF type:complete len:415 (-),score=71.07 TRINITY_DN3039_c0_g1_i2:164-1408(-)
MLCVYWCLFYFFVFFFSSRRRHTRCREVSWARRCVQETDVRDALGRVERSDDMDYISALESLMKDKTLKMIPTISSIKQSPKTASKSQPLTPKGAQKAGMAAGKKPLRAPLGHSQEKPVEKAAKGESIRHKRPLTSVGSQRKKAGTPIPSSSPILAASQGLQATARQTKGSKPEAYHSAYLSLAKSNSKPKEFVSPAQRQLTSLMLKNIHKYHHRSNLGSSASSSKLSKPNLSIKTNDIGIYSVPKIPSGISSIVLKDLEASATKKLNRHSSSLDKTDWMANYEKIRKSLNVNSPKESASSSGRVSSTAIRRETKKVAMLREYVPGRPLATPTPPQGRKGHVKQKSMGKAPAAPISNSISRLLKHIRFPSESGTQKSLGKHQIFCSFQSNHFYKETFCLLTELHILIFLSLIHI